MRTGRSLTVCRSLLPRGCLLQGGVCSQGGSVPGGCLLWGGVCSRGWCLLQRGSAPKGVSAPGGCLLPGVSTPGGYLLPGGCLLQGSALGWVSQHALRQTPPVPCGQNHRCLEKHYLGPSSLRLVIMMSQIALLTQSPLKTRENKREVVP